MGHKQLATRSPLQHERALSAAHRVDDDTRRLDTRFGSLGYYFIKGSCCHFCDGRDIVEKTDQSDAKVSALFSDSEEPDERSQTANRILRQRH